MCSSCAITTNKPLSGSRSGRTHQIRSLLSDRSSQAILDFSAPVRPRLPLARESAGAEFPFSNGYLIGARQILVQTTTCNTRRRGRNWDTSHPEGSRTPWGIRLGASTNQLSRARPSWLLRRAVRGTCRRTRAPEPLRPQALTAALPSCQRCSQATSRPSKSQQRWLRRHRPRPLAADASVTLLAGLTEFAWYIPFAPEWATLGPVPVWHVEL